MRSFIVAVFALTATGCGVERDDAAAAPAPAAAGSMPLDDLPPDVRTVAEAMTPAGARIVRAERLAVEGTAVDGADDIAAELARVSEGTPWNRARLKEAAQAAEKAARKGKRAPAPRPDTTARVASKPRTPRPVVSVYYLEMDDSKTKRTYRAVLAVNDSGRVQAFTHCDHPDWRADVEAIVVPPTRSAGSEKKP